MSGKVQFELVSPERLLISEPVDMVVVPGGEGDFGVLPGHAPLIATVRPGVISIHEGKAVTQRIFVSGGFAEVDQQSCTVLAVDGQPVEKIDRAATELKIRDLKDDIAAEKDDIHRQALSRQLFIEEARLAAVA